MQRLRDRQRVMPAPERIQYFAERGLEQAVEQVEVVAAVALSDAADAAADADAAHDAADAADARVDDVLDGTEAFSAINAAGTDVAPFLAHTDGTQLVATAGLGDDVVETRKIAVEAVVQTENFFDASAVSIGTAEGVLATVVIDSEAGDVIDIATSTSLNVSAATALSIIRFRIFRDATPIYTAFVEYAGIGEVRYSTPTPTFSEEPGMGPFTYTLQAVAITGGGTIAAPASNRFMRATRYLKTGA